MSTQPVSSNVYVIDAPFLGEQGVLGTYVVKGEFYMIVDPGPTVSIPYIIQELDELGVKTESLKYVASTHIHLDHAGGSWKLLDVYPKARLLVHPRGSKHMVDPTKLEAAARSLFGDRVSSYGEVRGVSAERVVESREGEELDLGGVTVRVIWTPGHASHHQSFFVPEDGVIIVGDAGGFHFPGTGAIMPTTPPPFNPRLAVESLEKLIALKPEFVCYGHFGASGNAVEKLEAHKRQILLWSRLVEEGLSEGLDLREIYTKIKTEDPMALMAGEFSSGLCERSSLINLLGFVRYYEWMEEKR
jgi:glyoxylase-like metal-dependent hydrolase (beta-lactamase superfamily II)